MKDRLKRLRKDLDLTQKEFAEKIGSSQNVLANYEIGRRNPSSSVINNICKTFGVSEEWLRNGTGEMFIEKSRSEVIAEFAGNLMKDEEESFKRRFVEALAQLDTKDWEDLERLVQKLTKKD